MTDWSSSITGAVLRPVPGQTITRMVEAAEDMAAAEVLVYLNGTESGGLEQATRADASAATSCKGVLGLRLAGSEKSTDGTCDSGEVITVAILGPVTGLTGLDETKEYFVSDTAGYGADAAGTVTRSIGWPLSSTAFNFTPANTPSS